MNYDIIINAIGSLGFPIVACIYMAYIVNKQEENHKQGLDKVTEAINDLRVLIASITGKDS